MPEPEETTDPTTEPVEETSALDDLMAPETEPQADDAAKGEDDTPTADADADADAVSTDDDTATAETETPAAAEFDDEILDLARHYGVNDSDARATGSVAALERKLAKIEFAEPAPTEPKAPEQPSAQPAVPGAEAPEAIKIESREFLDDEFFEQLNSAFNKLSAAQSAGHAEEIKDLKTQLAGLRDYLTITGLDDQIRTHGSAYKEALGEGPTFSLDNSSDQYKARLDLIPQMRAIIGSYQANGLPTPSSKDLFQLAAQMKHGNPAIEAARQEGAEAATQRLSQGIERPNARPDRRSAAVASHANPNLTDLVAGMVETEDEKEAALVSAEDAFESHFN